MKDISKFATTKIKLVEITENYEELPKLTNIGLAHRRSTDFLPGMMNEDPNVVHVFAIQSDHRTEGKEGRRVLP